MLRSSNGLGAGVAAGLGAIVLFVRAAFAAEGRPVDWQLGFQPAAT